MGMKLHIGGKDYTVKFNYNCFCDTDLLDRVSDLANNEQITEGIEEAAYNAMIRALEENKSSVDVTFRVEGDPQGLVRIMKQEERAYYQRTGKMLFVQ